MKLTMDTATAALLGIVNIFVIAYGGWACYQRHQEARRVEEEQARADARRVAKIRDEEAQRRYERTRRAAGLDIAPPHPRRVQQPRPAYVAPSPAPYTATTTPTPPSPSYDYTPHLASSWHSAPSHAPAPSFDWGSSSSCDSSSSSSYDSSSSSCDSSSSSSSWD